MRDGFAHDSLHRQLLVIDKEGFFGILGAPIWVRVPRVPADQARCQRLERPVRPNCGALSSQLSHFAF